MEMQLDKRLALAERAAREAGAYLLSHRSFHVREKGANDYVTEIDEGCEQMIRRILLDACPEDGFYGEESGQSARAAAGRWIVDPIDGTVNFIKDIPLYTISIAYQQAGELLLGAVYCPPLHEMFLAAKGLGATCNGRPIHVSAEADPARSVASISFAARYPQAQARMLQLFPLLTGLSDIRRFGSAAFDLCSVACGRVEAFVEPKLQLYDIAAGLVIVREAGGEVVGWPGVDDVTSQCDVLATNGKLTAWFLERLDQV